MLGILQTKHFLSISKMSEWTGSIKMTNPFHCTATTKKARLKKLYVIPRQNKDKKHYI